MKKKHKWSIGILILVLTMALFAACGKDAEETTNSQDTEMTENKEQTTDDEDDTTKDKTTKKDEQKDEIEHTDNTEKEKEEKGEVPIYSINDESLESEQTYVEMEEITPKTVVQAVVDSLAEHSLEVGIDSVTMEGDTVIVSFLFGKAPLTSVGSTVEETILNSIADSLLDNVEGCKNVIFRAEGEAYESGHYAFGFDEVYASE